MFSINIAEIDGQVHFTIVRLDTTFCSGQRDTRQEVFDIATKEMVSWAKRQDRDRLTPVDG